MPVLEQIHQHIGFLVRVIAKSEVIHHNPLIERLYTLEPGDLSAEIDELIRRRQAIRNDELSNP